MTGWGVVHLVPPGWDPDAEDADAAIEDTCEYARSYLQIARELWTLVDPERARRIEALEAKAYERKARVLEASEIAAIRDALTGLEGRFAGGWMARRPWRRPRSAVGRACASHNDPRAVRERRASRRDRRRPISRRDRERPTGQGSCGRTRCCLRAVTFVRRTSGPAGKPGSPGPAGWNSDGRTSNRLMRRANA
jgi:hypothetical protein